MFEFNEMFGSDGFTDSALRAVSHAIRRASQMGHTYVGTEHLLLGLLSEEGSAAASILERFSVSYKAVERKIYELIGTGEPTDVTGAQLTPAAYKRALQEVCYMLDVSTPVTLPTHYKHFERFNRVKYLPRDFVEDVDFTAYILERVVEKKKPENYYV